MRRVEIEALTPKTEQLERLVSTLKSACTLEPATDSKYRTGLVATGRVPPPPSEPTPPAIDATARMDAVAFAELRHRLAQWHAHEPGARLGEDVRELHDLRVAARRINAAARLFEDFLPHTITPKSSPLKTLLTVLGTCRDYDVQLAELERLAETFPESQRTALESVRARVKAERERARRQMLKALDSPATHRWFETLAATVLDPPAAPTRHPRPLAIDLAPRLIRSRYRKFYKRASRLDDDSPVEAYHAARTRLKKLRYAIETFAPLYGREAHAFLKRVASLQDRLGEQQDAHVASTRMAAFALIKTGRLPHSAAFLMGRIAEKHDAAAAKARSKFSKAFKRVRGKRWKQMRRAMNAQADSGEGR